MSDIIINLSLQIIFLKIKFNQENKIKEKAPMGGVPYCFL